MTHQTIRGHILYTSRKPERLGVERGREYFTIVRHSDGRRTLQAHCEIDDTPNVLRLVTTSVDAAWNPTDAFVRVSLGDRLVGSSWYRFSDRLAECEGFTRTEGRFSQHYDLSSPIMTLGTHPIQADAWTVQNYPLDRGPGKFTLSLMITSLDHRGATGPVLTPLETDLIFIGRERVSVPAGDFNALHFQFGSETWDEGDLLRHPPYDVWCTDDGEFIFLKGGCGGYMQTYYELQTLETYG